MKPQRAWYKKDPEALINCYCFQIEDSSESKRLIINMNKNKAYFMDEQLDLLAKNEVHDYFSEEWVQELIHTFLKNRNVQTFEYFFEIKRSRVTRSEHLIFNLFSNVRPESYHQGISQKPAYQR